MKHRTNSKKSIRGYSLLEMLITVSILGMLMTVAFTFLNATTREFEDESRSQFAHQTSWEVIETLMTELQYARLTRLVADGSELRFMVPVDLDGDGDFLDASDNVTWGAVVNGLPTANAEIIYQFTGENGGATFEVLDEALDGVEYNEDAEDFANKSTTDIFVRGSLIRTVGATAPKMVLANVVQPQGLIGGDVDHDAALAPDPIFSLSTNSDVFVDSNGNGVPDSTESLSTDYDSDGVWDGSVQINIWCIVGLKSWDNPSIVNRNTAVRLANYY